MESGDSLRGLGVWAMQGENGGVGRGAGAEEEGVVGDCLNCRDVFV